MTTESEPRKVAAIMMIRDEGDIIEANIRHHTRLGVDHFVILDHGSADATADILRALTAEGLPLTVLTYARDAKIELSQWYAALFARVRELGAEIIVQIDGDEFWHLTTGSFAKLDWSEPVITAPRFNMFAPRAAVGSCDSAPTTHIYRNRRPFHPEDYLGKVIRGDRDIAFDYPVHMVRIGPKVVFLLKEMGEIMMAGHGIISHTGEMLQPKPNGSAMIFHYPLRSFEQFAKKVAAFGVLFEQHPDLDRGISWQTRYLWELDEPGALERAFLRCFPEEAELRHWLDTGVLVRDTRMVRVLADGPCTFDAELEHLAMTADRVILDLIEDLSAKQRTTADRVP
ncbi:glycosyltransferase family 2 protein [Allorhizobium sp. BGMRC 0089]|uniref:glycosyltransferase family 2 protein n=1 Tax=Allorhizobium sonneratiae TaxID=2934936 RepID=UPI0020348A3F|nr:glycosyltransferase family 2 protein [Allorhizobium sonneratiae]MCM2292519.1 glycosyltransferase family 2 protein [Allorhizobium sonneratiae]